MAQHPAVARRTKNRGPTRVADEPGSTGARLDGPAHRNEHHIVAVRTAAFDCGSAAADVVDERARQVDAFDAHIDLPLAPPRGLEREVVAEARTKISARLVDIAAVDDTPPRHGRCRAGIHLPPPWAASRSLPIIAPSELRFRQFSDSRDAAGVTHIRSRDSVRLHRIDRGAWITGRRACPSRWTGGVDRQRLACTNSSRMCAASMSQKASA